MRILRSADRSDSGVAGAAGVWGRKPPGGGNGGRRAPKPGWCEGMRWAEEAQGEAGRGPCCFGEREVIARRGCEGRDRPLGELFSLLLAHLASAAEMMYMYFNISIHGFRSAKQDGYDSISAGDHTTA